MTRIGAIIALLFTAALTGGCGSSVPATKGSNTSRGSTLDRERKAVVDAAYRWIGTPYRPGGTDREGMDCSGFVTTVYQSIGRSLPRTARDMFSEGRSIPQSATRPGDLVFFKNTAGRGITHVGIFVGSMEFIHSSTSKGVIVSRLDDDYYRKHYAGTRRILE